MSPEQVIGAKTIDFKTDLWSLGVVAYEAMTGDKPFFAETVGALALKIHRDPIPVPSAANPALGSAVDAWFARACAREPAGRYESAKDMADSLAMAVTGAAIAPGLRVDSVPTPRQRHGFDTTQAASPAASTKPSGIDARSETGAGVGLVASETLPVASRGKWLVLGGIAVVAVGVGFVVPRMMAGPAIVATGTPTVLATTPPPTPTPTPTSTPTPTHPGKGKPSPSAPPSATPPAPTPTLAKPPLGSDDDIK
jgi:serine/threonine-protein kinase